MGCRDPRVEVVSLADAAEKFVFPSGCGVHEEHSCGACCRICPCGDKNAEDCPVLQYLEETDGSDS